MVEETNVVHPSDSRFIKYGYTTENFGGYLWLDNKVVTLSAIISWNENLGNLSKLIRGLISDEYIINVYCPSIRMKSILDHYHAAKRIDEEGLTYYQITKL